MKTGNIIHIKDTNNDKNNYWYVESICLGALNQESVIHLSRADGTGKPSCLGKKRAMFVPVIMIERLIDAGIATVYDKFPEHKQELTA